MPLSYSPSTAPRTPLPPGVTREFINSPQGPLELLSAIPSSSKNKTPLFFNHGGFGCAAVWLEWMTFLSAVPHNIPCYALSYRGHGASWKPGYLRMTFGTTKRMLADDIVTGVKHVESLLRQQGNPGTKVVLVAHSNGGGLCQLALNDGDIQVKALALIDATPPFGLLGVYINWFRADPWFPIRIYWHLFHARSPLSSTALVKNAFFCDEYPIEKIPALEKLMAPYESMLWPSSMFWRFISIRKVLGNVNVAVGRPSVLVMAAEKSRLMDPAMMRRAADEYAMGIRDVLLEEDKEVSASQVAQTVSYELIRGAGHHLQNDLQWRDGAEKMAKFYKETTAA
ncbi:Alpha/Beta hydrolase protein [Elsinoe ampelina]|uniref:Alpha/Beta hydrolase protein n=1 Tax=Elsinoe ampelina TaxID=302913 RepID=A0A6A6G2R6_9PEZI|nr:Alpha/Beta hydrolase protein [Elsinoe ampelina]